MAQWARAFVVRALGCDFLDLSTHVQCQAWLYRYNHYSVGAQKDPWDLLVINTVPGSVKGVSQKMMDQGTWNPPLPLHLNLQRDQPLAHFQCRQCQDQVGCRICSRIDHYWKRKFSLSLHKGGIFRKGLLNASAWWFKKPECLRPFLAEN